MTCKMSLIPSTLQTSTKSYEKQWNSILKVLVKILMVAQLYKFTKSNWIVHLQWVNFIACKLYFDKAPF